MTDIAADIARLLELESELDEIAARIALLVPESPRLYEPVQMARIYTAQAASGCQRAARYLKQAAREAMGGE